MFDLDGREREVDVIVEHPAATVADLLDAALDTALAANDDATTHRPLGVLVEGRWFSVDHGLDELNLHEGAIVRPADAPSPGHPAPAGPPIAVVGGPAAGRTVWLDGRTASLGREPACDVVLPDPTVSEWHAELAPAPDGGWVVRDLGSSNGTWVDGVAVTGDAPVPPGATIALGTTRLRLRDEFPDDRPLGIDPFHRASGGLVPFNRPPRGRQPEPVAEVELPVPPPVTARARALSVAAIVAPIVLAGVLVWVTRNPRFALFLLLSPVMAISNWASSRRQVKKETRTNSRAFRRALDRLDLDLDGLLAAERARRESVLPDLAEVARRIETPSSALWQRRPTDTDFLRLRVGVGDAPWEPPLTVPREGREPEVVQAVERARVLSRAPLEVDLSNGGVVGLVGDRAAALDVARSLVCQAAAHHGPADLGIAVLTDLPRARDWEWAKWLPHVRAPGGIGRLLAAGGDAATGLLQSLLGAAPERPRGARVRDDAASAGRTLLVVLDDVSLTSGRRAPARLVLRGDAGPVAGIVIAETVDQLPAVTTTVVTLHDAFGDADLRRPAEGFAVDDLVVDGLSDAHAIRLARVLARYEDPESEAVGASVPRGVRLLPVLGLADLHVEALVEAVLTAWTRGLPDPAPTTPIGIGEDGVVSLDLVADGPHGLIGGTTGSGKSELLRSLVAGMAARVDPDHLNFVLVDYKGGSAFDRCAELPHTVGMVTDLDDHLGERALRSLEAELHHRETLLRRAGAQDLPAYLTAGAPLGPLPRLVVVIDEFATLAAELPEFLGSLVGIAQRGRSLGVHLLLATQRPSGAVNANIKANTNLRIALRVQDAGDSTDIIDRTDAAAIPRSLPGRAYVRLGPSDVVMVQTALSSALSEAERPVPVQLVPFRFLPSSPPPDRTDTEAGTDLDRLVGAIATAFERTGSPAPRRPWLEPLPERVELDDVLAAAGSDLSVPIGLGDDPDRQRQVPVGWDPTTGHLGVFGTVGSGTTTTLITVAFSLAERHAAGTCHIHAFDFGPGGLAPIADLPHVGTVVPATAGELRGRLLRHLRHELDRRRDLPPTALAEQPLIVVLVDGIGSLLAEFESPAGIELGEQFKRVFADGPAVRIVFVVAGDRAGELPMRYGALIARRLMLKHADPQDFSAIGVRPKDLPRFVPGLAVESESHDVVQVGLPGDPAARVADLGGRDGADAGPIALRTLPAEVIASDLPPGESRSGGLWLPIAIAEEDLAPVPLVLHPGDHALIAGAPRAGVSSALALLAHQVRRADPVAVIIGICSERSPLYGIDPLDAAGPLQDLVKVLAAAPADARRWVLLIEDAPAVADVDGILARLLAGSRPGLHVIGGGRADAFRGGFSHWTRELRRSRLGVLLRPDLASDGDLLGARLPRRVPVESGVIGRGFVVVDGEAVLCQLARPPAGPRPPVDPRPPGAA